MQWGADDPSRTYSCVQSCIRGVREYVLCRPDRNPSRQARSRCQAAARKDEGRTGKVQYRVAPKADAASTQVAHGYRAGDACCAEQRSKRDKMPRSLFRFLFFLLLSPLPRIGTIITIITVITPKNSSKSERERERLPCGCPCHPPYAAAVAAVVSALLDALAPGGRNAHRTDSVL